MDRSLGGRTILVESDEALTREIADQLERYGARVVVCPPVEISEPDDYALLDEAIENLFGYHWLIVPNVNSAEYFLRRFHFLGHEISGLEALRICAIGEAAARRLEESQTHIDLIPPERSSEAGFRAIENYAGGRDTLRRLNFLLPRAAISSDPLPQALEDAGARVDVVAAYRTVAPFIPALAQINALLAGGGIDCVVFISPSSVESFAELFDTNDLASLLRDVTVACLDRSTNQAARALGLIADITPAESTIPELTSAVASHLSP